MPLEFGDIPEIDPDADTEAIAALTGTGGLHRTASDTWALRTLTGGTGITVTNGDGVSGNPTLSLDADLQTWAGVTPSADGQSLVSAANYAAMRGLLDLEAGTDFYSIAAADAAFQPLDSVLTNTTASFTTTDEDKLDNIEALADVTDETNVVAALDGATLTDVGTPASGDRILLQDADDAGNLKTADFSEFRPEGTEVLSTGEAGGSKFLREDGDGTCSWQALPGGGDMLAANNLSDLTDDSAARSNLGVAIGSDVQAYDAGLAYFAGLSITDEATFKSEVNLEIGTDVQAYSAALDAAAATLAGHLYGMTLSNNSTDATNDIDFAAGQAIDSTNAQAITCSAMTKRLDAAWAAGTGNGGLDTGSIANTTYHCFAIKKDSDGSGDFLFSASATSPTMPSGYTYFRRIGSIVRASGAIRAFSQFGDRFLYDAPIGGDYNTANPGTSAVTITLSVPTGGLCEAIIDVTLLDLTPASNTVLWISPLSMTDVDPGAGSGTAQLGIQGAAGKASIPERSTGQLSVATNASAQIRARLNASDADRILVIQTSGWIDRRGRLG